MKITTRSRLLDAQWEPGRAHNGYINKMLRQLLGLAIQHAAFVHLFYHRSPGSSLVIWHSP